MSILSLSDGLFRPPDDKLRVDAFIPPLGRQCIKYVRFTEDWIRDQIDLVYPTED